MSQSLDSKLINEGSLIFKKESMTYYLVLEYEFYLDAKGNSNHSFIMLDSDKVITWYSSHDLEDIINISGDCNEQRKN